MPIESYFLEDIWNKNVVPIYSTSDTFKAGFAHLSQLTAPLLELIDEYSDERKMAISTAIDGLQACNNSGFIDGKDFFQWGSGNYEKAFKGITEMPCFYGAVRGMSDTARIILSEGDSCGFVLRKLYDFAKEKGVRKN